MCRNIKMLFNFEPPATEAEIRAASFQYVRKISGYNRPSTANRAAFLTAVDAIAISTKNLLNSLETTTAPRNRAQVAAKAQARALRSHHFAVTHA